MPHVEVETEGIEVEEIEAPTEVQIEAIEVVQEEVVTEVEEAEIEEVVAIEKEEETEAEAVLMEAEAWRMCSALQQADSRAGACQDCFRCCAG